MIAEEPSIPFITLASLTTTCRWLYDLTFPLLMRKAVHFPHETVLDWASTHGYIRVVKGLLEAGADANGYCRGIYTALMHASQRGHEEVVDYLISHGANLDINIWGETALTLAACYNHARVVKTLLHNGASFNREHWWAITYATEYGYTDVVKLLLEHGVNPDSQVTDAFHDILSSALYSCFLSGAVRIDMVTLLMEHGANSAMLLRSLPRHIFLSLEGKILYELCRRSLWRMMRWKLYYWFRGSARNFPTRDYYNDGYDYRVCSLY